MENKLMYIPNNDKQHNPFYIGWNVRTLNQPMKIQENFQIFTPTIRKRYYTTMGTNVKQFNVPCLPGFTPNCNLIYENVRNGFEASVKKILPLKVNVT